MRILSRFTRPFILASVGVVLLGSVSHSQSIYLPTSHEVYWFLKRMEARELLTNYRDAVKPLSRLEITTRLKALESRVNEMTPMERDEYEFLKGEFTYELAFLAGDPEPSEIRWHLVSTEYKGGVMNFDLIGRFSYLSLYNGHDRLRDQGVRLYGYAFNDVGYYFNFADSREVGSGINVNKVNTPDPGIVLTKQTSEAIEYNTTEAQLTFHIGAFQFSLEKMQNDWGLARHGNLTFSYKAPSYPQIKMRVPVTDWLDFTYLHAELNSNIIDSSRSYHAYSSSLMDIYRPVDHLKYMAAHMVEFTPFKGVDVSLGESVVYSDRGPLLIYLIPIMFFKSAEHYNGDKDNIQWFGNLDLNVIPKLNLYFSLFIDELNLDDITKPLQERNQIGVTAGFQTYDIPFKNLELIAEYTRINPWVYSHKYPETDFTNNGYVMGNWMGQNADNLYLDLSYRPKRSIAVGAMMQVFRKGGLADVAYQYRTPSLPFLHGPSHEERSFGLHARYEIFRDGFLDAHARSLTLSDESLGINKEKKIEWGVSLRYGLW